VRAIETIYQGYKFRSRLEARYAVLFDALHFDWSYEPEGFELDSGLYLPDFRVDDIPFWLEVKGMTPSRHELLMAEELCELTREDVWVCHGDLMHFEADEIRLRHHQFSWIMADDEMIKDFIADPDEYGGSERVKKLTEKRGEVFTMSAVLPGEVAQQWKRSLLEVARGADKMRSARFEHGDAPPRSSY
jgi:hypothetical protein